MRRRQRCPIVPVGTQLNRRWGSFWPQRSGNSAAVPHKTTLLPSPQNLSWAGIRGSMGVRMARGRIECKSPWILRVAHRARAFRESLATFESEREPNTGGCEHPLSMAVFAIQNIHNFWMTWISMANMVWCALFFASLPISCRAPSLRSHNVMMSAVHIFLCPNNPWHTWIVKLPLSDRVPMDFAVVLDHAQSFAYVPKGVDVLILLLNAKK